VTIVWFSFIKHLYRTNKDGEVGLAKIGKNKTDGEKKTVEEERKRRNTGGKSPTKGILFDRKKY
jgi:hypothetical protein